MQKPGSKIPFPNCVKHQIESTLKKVRIQAVKEKSKQKREYKEQNKSIAKLIQEARKPFQQWIRMRDANNACISCGSVDAEIWDAGHLYKAELYSGMIFDDRNCNKQCRKCNTYLDGNEGEYRKRLIQIFGQKWVEDLDLRAEYRKSYKYDRDELNEIKKKYLKLCRSIKS